MFPYNYAANVPRAGIRTCNGEGVADCMKSDDNYYGGSRQTTFRNSRLDEPGQRLHTPGIMDPEPSAPNGGFGVHSGAKNYSTSECLHIDPEHTTQPYKEFLELQESGYHRSHDQLGRVPKGVANIPEEQLRNGFGVITRFGESAGSVIHNSKEDIPNDVTLRTGYQKNRNYDWKAAGINPRTHTFGVSGQSEIDHINELYQSDKRVTLVPTAVERSDHNAILQDPDPLDLKTGIYQHTLTSKQLKGTVDPADRPPAGLATISSEFSIGDTISEMGCMDAFDADYHTKEREIHAQDLMVHGVPTRPNPFPNPLKGPGRYSDLGLTDESFLLRRDKKHIVPVMVKALALTEEEAGQIFDTCSSKYGRNTISIAEFHQEFKENN